MREETVGGIEFQNVMLIYHEYVNYPTTKFCCLIYYLRRLELSVLLTGKHKLNSSVVTSLSNYHQ